MSSRTARASLTSARALLVLWGPRALGAGYVLLGFLMLLSTGTSREPLGLNEEWNANLTAVAIAWSGLGVGLLIGSQSAVLVCLLVPLGVVLHSISQPETSTVLLLAGLVPFQVAGHLALQSSLGLIGPLAPWNLVAYAAHVLFLAPATSSILEGFRLRWHAARRARERRRTLAIPATVADLYQRNAYKTLGLRPTAASTRAILRRRDEIKTLLDADMPVEENLGGYCRVDLGVPVSLDGGEVVRAVARLQDEPARYREALLWFGLDGEDEAVLSALTAGHLHIAEQTWAARDDSGRNRCQAAYNLAVLSHARVIMSEPQSAPPHAISNAAAWKRSFELWRRVLEDPRSWDEIAHLVSTSTHPLVNEEYLGTLRNELPARILRVNLELARAGLEGGFSDYARDHVRQVAESDFPAPDVESALDRFFASDLGAARQLLKPLLLQSETLTDRTDFKKMSGEYRSIRERLAVFGAESRLADLVEEAIQLGRQRMVRDTDVTFRRFTDADNECFKANSSLVDQWNAHMHLHNLGLPQHPQLRRLSSQLDARRDALAVVSERLEEFVASVRREQVGFECLRTLSADASAATRWSIEVTSKNEHDAVAAAREEFRKTREHFERNRSGMASQLSA